MQQINFTENLTRGRGARRYVIIKEVKETVLDFSKGTVKVLWFYFVSIYTFFFLRKPFFLSESQFSEHNARN